MLDASKKYGFGSPRWEWPLMGAEEEEAEEQ
jgi:hypothetical protein